MRSTCIRCTLRNIVPMKQNSFMKPWLKKAGSLKNETRIGAPSGKVLRNLCAIGWNTAAPIPSQPTN